MITIAIYPCGLQNIFNNLPIIEAIPVWRLLLLIFMARLQLSRALMRWFSEQINMK